MVMDGVVVRFCDETEVKSSILVGADGTKSKIKKQLLLEHRFVDTEGQWLLWQDHFIVTPELQRTVNEVALKGLTLVQDRTKEMPLSLLLEPVS